MKRAASPRRDRSAAWRAFAIAILLSLALHAIGSLVFTARPVTRTNAHYQPPLVTFLSPEADAPSIDEFRRRVALADPSASSLPNREGFSRQSIRRLPELTSLIEAPLSNPQFLGRPNLNPTQVMIVAESPVGALLALHATKQPAPAVEVGDVLADFHAPVRESSFLLGGPIRDRRLLSLVNIPTIRSPAPAQPTVVRVCLSPVGEVRFAVLETGSGADDKDARAVDIIRRWRFQAVSDTTGDQWGTVSVYWAAEAPAPAPSPVPATNGATNPPASKAGG